MYSYSRKSQSNAPLRTFGHFISALKLNEEQKRACLSFKEMNTSFRHEWAQGVSFLIPQQLGRIKYLNHFQVRVQINSNNHGKSTVCSESMQEVGFSILQPSTRHFLWSILYVIYNSYLKLLIWGRKPLMNFVLIRWLFCYSFFHEMQWNLGWLPIPDPFVPRAKSLRVRSIDTIPE